MLQYDRGVELSSTRWHTHSCQSSGAFVPLWFGCYLTSSKDWPLLSPSFSPWSVACVRKCVCSCGNVLCWGRAEVGRATALHSSWPPSATITTTECDASMWCRRQHSLKREGQVWEIITEEKNNHLVIPAYSAFHKAVKCATSCVFFKVTEGSKQMLCFCPDWFFSISTLLFIDQRWWVLTGNKGGRVGISGCRSGCREPHSVRLIL